MAANAEYLTKDEFRREMRHYVTKSDLAQMETRLVKWMVGAMLASAGDRGYGYAGGAAVIGVSDGKGGGLQFGGCQSG